jgi:hypothetical protein
MLPAQYLVAATGNPSRNSQEQSSRLVQFPIQVIHDELILRLLIYHRQLLAGLSHCLNRMIVG